MRKTAKQETTRPRKLSPAQSHALATLGLLLSLVIFFWGIIAESKTFIASDTIASKSFETLMRDASEQDVFPLWNPYIFCGMPGYASTSVIGERFFDISNTIMDETRTYFAILLNRCDVGYEIFYYFLLGVGTYWLVHRKLKNKIAAFITGLAVMHSTNIATFIMIGHMTKVPVVAFLPFILMILEELQERFRWWLALVLAVLVHYMLKPTHLQMIFYMYFALGIYFVYFFIRFLVRKESIRGLVRSGAVFALASAFAVGMTADQYLQTYEYSKYSIRGSNPILSNPSTQNDASSTTGGLDYDYATNWSFPPSELFTFFIPSAYGFGWHHYQGALTQNQPVRINTYFGPQPFVDSAQYFGILVLVLGVVGFWKNRKDPFIQFSGIVIVLAVLISFGREFPLFYDFMFYYFPMFNKFRVPSMILILVQLFMPILAGYGLHWLLTEGPALNDQMKRRWRNAGWVLAGVAFISFALREAIIAVYQIFVPRQTAMATLTRSFGDNRVVLDEIYAFITRNVATDVMVESILVTVLIVLLLLHWKNKISLSLVAPGLIVIVLADLWRINYKPMELFPKQKLNDYFATPDYVRFLQRDTTIYRVLEFENGHPPYNNSLAYFRIQNAYGYHGAKPRQIQDIFDVVGLGNPLLWGLMDAKYIISDRPDSSQLLRPVFSGGRHVFLNRNHLPRAFFVNRYQVASGLDILNQIKEMKFDPRDVTFFLEDPRISIEPPAEGATVKFLHYGIQDFSLSVRATGTNLLFLSETWYPAGWKAYVDGQEVPIHRLNYMFRGIVVPFGEHTVHMSFEPRSFLVGKTISLVTNLIVLGGLLFYAAQWITRFWRQRSVVSVS
ncbi:MAG: YfhO family protein [Ignavibacteriales bacterium]|nr:YfhO family protein [Ignavibacteriales bacterium]